MPIGSRHNRARSNDNTTCRPAQGPALAPLRPTPPAQPPPAADLQTLKSENDEAERLNLQRQIAELQCEIRHQREEEAAGKGKGDMEEEDEMAEGEEEDEAGRRQRRDGRWRG